MAALFFTELVHDHKDLKPAFWTHSIMHYDSAVDNVHQRNALRQLSSVLMMPSENLIQSIKTAWFFGITDSAIAPKGLKPNSHTNQEFKEGH